MSYDSQEDAIFELATKRGISHEAIWDCFDKTIDKITARYPDKSPDWRLEKAEEGVWLKFFPEKQFPGTKAEARTASRDLTVQTVPTSKVRPRGDENQDLAKFEPRLESFKLTERFGGGNGVKANAEPLTGTSGNNLSRAITSSVKSFTGSGALSPSGSYVLQAKLITSKAVELGLQMNDFQTIFNEKKRIAQNRFPGENADWQAWFAESMVWSFYFKNCVFPGVEPPRTYPLRSNTTDENFQRGKNGSLGDKWEKFRNLDNSPKKVVNGVTATMIDSYRPDDTVIVRTTMDRGMHLSIDSYRPSGSTAPRPIQIIPSSHSVNVSNLDHSNRSPRLNHSNALTRSDGLSYSAGPSNAPAATVSSYSTQEKVMERKAMALGIRREFFQFLQKKRDEVRAEHAGCSSQYRAWAADTLVWSRFFKDSPFPVGEPRGTGLHSRNCPNKQSLSSSERLSRPQGTQVALQKAPQSLDLFEQYSLPKAKTRSVTQVQPFTPTERLPQPRHAPTELVIELNKERMAKQSSLSQETKALMINRRIIWMTALGVQKITDWFSAIDAEVLDMAENELKCHLRSFRTSTGDAILWNEAFLIENAAAFERGSKFLDGLFDFTSHGRSGISSFTDYWKKFNDEENDIGRAFLVLVNGKFFNCSLTEFNKLRSLIDEDKPALMVAEESTGYGLKCNIFENTSQMIMSLYTSVPPSSRFRADKKSIRKRGNDFLEHWVRDTLSSETLGKKKPSIHWNDYISLKGDEIELLARLIIHDDSNFKIIIPCTALTLAKVSRAYAEDAALPQVKKKLNCLIQFDHSDDESDPNSMGTVDIKVESIVGGDTSAILMAVVSWAVKAAQDHEYLLSNHWKKTFDGQTTVRNSNWSKPISDSDIDSQEKDWQIYASTFQATDLDRMVIEEAAKAEGSLRMVFDEASGVVIGLGEFGRRVVGRAKEYRSVEVSDYDMDHSESLMECDQNRSDKLKDCGQDLSEGLKKSEVRDPDRTAKRKLEDGQIRKEDEQIEKKVRTNKIL